MNSPLANLLIFVIALALLAFLFAPHFGAWPKLLRYRRERERIRLEDSLKHAFDHAERGSAATLSSLAGVLRISPAKALALVEQMQQKGLLTVVDGRMVLSDLGRHYALEVIRAHRLWERYLADETGVDPLRWHALAERREHVLTRDEAEALSRKLGNPRFDPHGDPIPTANLEMPSEPTVPLTQLEIGERACVVHVEDEPDVVYAQLLAIGIFPGMEVRVEAKSPERLMLESEGRRLVLAPIVAGNVSIQRLPRVEAEDAQPSSQTLAQLEPGEAATVSRISPACRGLERRRLLDLGILPGTRVEHDRRGLTGGLTSYRIRGTRIALRDEQAELIAISGKEKIDP
jgi:DtxR family Mn-dependent transcriptional regulator